MKPVDLGEASRSRSRKGFLALGESHDCQHTCASILLSGGVSVVAVADYMGHSPAILLKTYAHIIPADIDRARSVLQAAFADLQTQTAEDVLRTDEGQQPANNALTSTNASSPGHWASWAASGATGWGLS
jgi:hypothetical protein